MGHALTAQLLAFRRADGRVEEMTDEALVAACAVTDSAALGTLFDRHHRRVHRFLCRVSGVDGADAEDLLQDTFTELWRSSTRYRGDAPALTWIFGIAANVARHHIRASVRRTRATVSLSEQPSGPSERPDDTAARREAIRKLQVALTGLPHDQRVAFVMCDIEGTAGVDAARVLGVRPGTIWRRLHEARKTLRARIGEAGR